MDYILPPIKCSAGFRFDESYWERFYFHVWDIGGPLAPYEDAYHGSPYDKLVEYFKSLSERWTKWKLVKMYQWRLRTRPWQETRYRTLARCLKALGKKKMARKMAVTARWYEEMQYDEFGYPVPASPSYYEEDTFIGYDYDLPSEPTETTSLLHSGISSMSCYSEWTLFYVVSQEETVCEQDYPVLSSPSPGPLNAQRPPALAKKGNTRKAFWDRRHRYLRPKSVRFSGVHKVMLYDKPSWEPVGCHKPNYSHLRQSCLGAVSSFFHKIFRRSQSTPDPMPSLDRVALIV